MDNAKDSTTMDQRDLIEINTKIGEAELARDDQFLRDVLDEKFQFRRANGELVNKEHYLETIISPLNTYDYLESEKLEVTVYENSAVVSLLVRAKGTRHKGRSDEKAFEGVYRNLRLFVKRDGDWQCAMWCNTRIEQP
jgi:hypothetical protein